VKVEGDVEVVVGERRVLRGVEDLKHGRRGIAAEVRAHLVDFVEHHDGIAGPGLAQLGDDPAGHRADVRAAVAADVGLVAHAAQRDPDELAAHRLGDALAEARLAHARRADEAENRTRAAFADPALLELEHGEILDDAALDLLQVMVIAVEDRAGFLQLDLVVGQD
jgi:hypothetical protein